MFAYMIMVLYLQKIVRVVKMNKTAVGGILTLIIILSSGTTWYVQDLGTKTSCRNGFEEVTQGEYEGYHSCTTTSGIRYELCFEVYNSSNTENYWCKKGFKVEVPEEPSIKQSTHSGRIESCGPRGTGCKPI